MVNFIVKTMFGDLTVERDNIKQARDWAKEAHGLGPDCVTAQREYILCDDCDSRPCVCPRP